MHNLKTKTTILVKFILEESSLSWGQTIKKALRTLLIGDKHSKDVQLHAGRVFSGKEGRINLS